MSSVETITKRSVDYAQWYLDVIKVASLADYAPVKGCMVIMPNGYAIWEQIQSVLNKKFRETGVKNAYFPLLIPESYLKKEAKHVEGFSPECAVVTYAGGKKLEEPLVIRPTSETIIYEMFSRWISSYRDLPLLINQWANIVRWEKRTRLFLRTSEFLWQEGHTAHANMEDADQRARQMQTLYKCFTEEYLAIPVFAGIKSESEKFAGADKTYTIEAMMQDGKALQMGTSHLLSENFTNAFNIKYLDVDGKEKSVRATSWGVSTRLIGGIIMSHSDDKGLVLPPKIAPTQVIVVAVTNELQEREPVLKKVKEIAAILNESGIRTDIDDRNLRPGPRFFEWEKKGIPIRIEIGPKEIEKKQIIVVRRDTGEKEQISDKKIDFIKSLLDRIQNDLFKKALDFRDKHTKEVSDYNEFSEQVKKGFAVAYWCEDRKCEKKINEDTKTTIRCIPFEQKNVIGKCICCRKTSKTKAIFAKSY